MSGSRSAAVADPRPARPVVRSRRRGVTLSLGAFALVLAGWFVPTEPASAADTSPPSAPRDLSVDVRSDGSMTASWSSSRDDVGVAHYVVYRNNRVVVDEATATTATVDLGSGHHYLQVRAVDAAGNRSPKTWPVKVSVWRDTSRPSAPRDLSVDVRSDGSLTASWSASQDNVGVDRYIMYRNNDVVFDDVPETAATVDLGPGSHWIQVRAVDAAGNESPKTWPVKVTVEPPDTSRPSTPRDLAILVDDRGVLTASWSASRDDVGVDRYVVYRNNEVVLDDVRATSATVNLGGGDHWIQVAAVDEAGNESPKTWPVNVSLRLDTSPPGAPRDLSVVVNADAEIVASWSASTDNVGVDHYVVYRNNEVVFDEVRATSATVDLGGGDHWIQVRAVDAAGNESPKTSPVKVTVRPPDTSPPGSPRDLSVVVNADGSLTASWSASTDNVGVARYVLYRNNAVIDDDVAGTEATADLGPGDHWIQVRAIDAAGNESRKTSPVKVTVRPPDTSPPSPVEPPAVDPPPTLPPAPDVPGSTPGGWDPLRARDEAGAVFPYELAPTDLPATIVVDASGGGDHTSIRAAISAAGSTDVIEVRSGVYRESLGVVNKPITLRAADGAHPVVLGTDRVTPANLSGSGDVRSMQLWTSNPLKSIDSGLNEHSYFSTGLVDAHDPHSAADLLPEQVFWVDRDGRWHEVDQRRHGTQLTAGTFSYDPNGKRFSVRLADWSAVDHLEVTTRREGLRLLGGADGSAVSGLEFRAFSPPTDGDGWATVATNGTHSDRLTDVVLRDVKVTDSASNGVSAYYATNLTLTRITADHNVIKGFNSGRVHGMRMEFSRFNDNNKDALRDAHSILAGAKVTGSTGDDPGSVIRYNSFADNRATGYWCDLWCENDTIVGNYAGDNTKHGLYYEVSEDAVIASNLVVRNGAAGIKVSGSHRVDIVRNTFAGNGQQIHLGTDTRPRTGPGDGNRRPGHPVVIDTSDIEIRGNVFAEVGGSASSLLYRVGGATGAGDRNLPSERLNRYEQNAHALATSDNGARRFEWDHHQSWQRPSDFLAHSGTGTTEVTVRSADPYSVFVAASSGDWRLQNGTPLASADAPALPSSALAEMVDAGSGAERVGAVFG